MKNNDNIKNLFWYEKVLAGVKGNHRLEAAKDLFDRYLDLGHSVLEAKRIIMLWNRRNSPPLKFEILKKVVQDVIENRKGRESKLLIVKDRDLLKFPVEEQKYLIDGFIPRKQLIVFAGKPGAYKSMLALKIAHHLASGEEFLGRNVFKCRALYIDAENGWEEMRRRLDILDVKDAGLDFAFNPPILKKYNYQELATKYSLIVMDSFKRLHTDDENSATDMSTVTKELIRMRNTGATTIVLHHSAKAEKGSVRGSGEIEAAADVVYSMIKMKGHIVKIVNRKNRSGPQHRPLYIKFINKGDGKFTFKEITQMKRDAAEAETRNHIERIAKMINAKSYTQGDLISEVGKKFGISKNKATNLLKKGEEKFWKIRTGSHNTRIYEPIATSEKKAA